MAGITVTGKLEIAELSPEILRTPELGGDASRDQRLEQRGRAARGSIAVLQLGGDPCRLSSVELRAPRNRSSAALLKTGGEPGWTYFGHFSEN